MLMIRLRRMGARNQPYYRVVVSDSQRTPKGAALEEIGHYNPHQDPPRLQVDQARVDHWLKAGAHLSPTVKKLLAAGAPPAVAAAPAAATK